MLNELWSMFLHIEMRSDNGTDEYYYFTLWVIQVVCAYVGMKNERSRTEKLLFSFMLMYLIIIIFFLAFDSLKWN